MVPGHSATVLVVVELLSLHCLPSCMASAAGSYNLINQILPAQFSDIPYIAVDAAGGERVITIHLLSLLHLPDKKAWDHPHMQETYDQLLHGASDWRLLAAATKETGAWLHAHPVPSRPRPTDR